MSAPQAPHPTTSGPGRIIFLTGASSSGKTSMARSIQRAMPTPFFHVASDHLAEIVPARRTDEGPFAWWTTVRPRFFDAFHRCLPVMAAAGNDLIVDHLIEFDFWRDQLRDLLVGLDVFLVGVHCDLDEIDRREHQRGDRMAGEGRGHIEIDRVHDLGPYDHEIDATGRLSENLATEVIDAWTKRAPSPSALFAR
jgi:chloramphenicol 3-O phosphotransferase